MLYTKLDHHVLQIESKIFLPKLINEDQVGFVPGRYIGDNLRTIYNIMQYLEKHSLPGLLVCIHRF